MAKYKFTAELSVNGIRKLRKELQNYKENILQHKIEMLAKMLSEKGVNIAQIQIADYNAIFTGELISSIKSEYGGSKLGTAIFYVVADSEHAAFVEFGTGQLGQKDSYLHPFPEGVNWEYNTGDTIFQISPGQYGWFYPMPDGTWRFTQGMPSRPFMYETWAELTTIVEQTAKEVFR